MLDRFIGSNVDLRDYAVSWRRYGVLHLHRLKDHDRLTTLDGVANCDIYPEDAPRHRCAKNVLTIDASSRRRPTTLHRSRAGP